MAACPESMAERPNRWLLANIYYCMPETDGRMPNLDGCMRETDG